MSEDIVSLETVDTMANVARALESGHHAFPILSKRGHLAGLIPRNFVITILKHNGFYSIEDDYILEETPEVKTYRQQNAKVARKAEESDSINTELDRDPLKRLKTQQGFKAQYKRDAFSQPDMPNENLLPWQVFQRDFWSLDLPYDEAVKQ